MSRVIRVNEPGKQRNWLMRTSAEIIRRLSQKPSLDDEAKDMTAMLALCLREIETGIDASAGAWEKRDYWLKAERFRTRWAWAGQAALALEGIILNDDWGLLPDLLAGLLPQFADIKIARFTRPPSLWRGAHSRLLGDNGAKEG
jgi:hypothetical protein